MKQKLFKCLTSNTMSSVMSRVSNECRMTLDRVSTLLLLLFALSLGFNQEAWADNTRVVGVAANNSNNYTMKINVNRKGDGDDWQTKEMSKAGLTFEGKKLYVTSYDEKYGGLGAMQFQLYSGTTWKEQKTPISSWKTDIHSNEIFNYDGDSWYSKLTMGKSKIYFNATGWNQTTIKLVVGHANYQAYYQMSKITNTQLYYGNPDLNWGDAMGFGVVGGTSASNGTNWLTNVSAKAQEYTGFLHYGLNNNGDNVMYYVTNDGKAGQKPTCDFHSAYTDLNKTQTIKVMVKKAGASSYTEEKTFTSWPATIKAKRYRLNSNGASKADETDADLTSATFTSVITSAAKIYVPTPNTGYTFKGWGTSSSATPSNASSAYEYTVDDTKTIYLFFDENTYSVTAAKGTGCASVSPTEAQTVGQITGKQFVATGTTGYHFVNWTSNNAGSFSSSASETTTFKPTGNATITANYAENTYTVTATYGAGGASATVTTSPAGEVTGTTINATAASGYIFSGWTISSGGGSFADSKAANTTYYPTLPSTLLATFARATVTVNSGISSNHATLSGTSTSHTITIGTDTDVPGDEDVTFTVSSLENGYQIEGWYTNSDYTEGKHDVGQSTYTLSSTNPNKNVYVKITPITYTITYNENGGTTQTDGTYTIESATITLPTAVQITKTNYTFLGWFDNSGLTGDAVTTIPTGSTGNKEYWAKWEETKYAVTLVNAQSPASPVQVGNVTDVQIVANTPTPGYYFVNWTKTGNVTIADANSATTTIKATGGGTVTANFAERFYLRGSIQNKADTETGGMPGWGDDAKESGKGLFTSIDGNTATITRNLNAATEYKLKLGDMTGNSWGGKHEFKSGEDLWTFTSNDKNCEAPTFKTAIAGTYTFTIDFSEASPKMKITYPTPDFTLQVAKTRVYEETTMQNFITGDGTENNPYQFYLDEKMHLVITAIPTVPGVTAYYKFGDDAESSSVLTKDITATTTKQSIVVKAYYKSTIGSYQSAEKTETIWYQGVLTPALHLTASWNEKEESELSDNPQVTIYYSTDHYSGAATVTQSTDGATPTTFMTITTETQKNQTYQMVNKQPHRYDFAASATVNERSFVAATSVSIYRLVEVRVKDTNHRMTKYYMWINGSNPIQEETAWPGNDFIGKLGDWHIFLVKYPSYTHFVLNNGKAGGADGAEQTVDVQLPASNTCYEIGAKEGTKYTVTDADDCPPILYVGDITNVTLHQGESQLITPEVDLDFGYNESQLQITFPDLPSGFTAVQQGKSFMLTGANQCGATSIKVIYTLDGYSVEKTFSATVTHPSNILIQVAINTSYGWNAKDQIRIMYFNHGLDGEKNMTWHHYANDEDYFYAKIPVGTDGKVDFLVHAWDFEKEHMDHQTTNMENVDMPGCFYVSNDFYDGKRGIARRGDDCWEEYQVVINMANGKTYYSNKVENLNDIVSFYAPGKDETGNKSGLVRILRNGTQVATISANTFTKSGIYIAKITDNGAGLSDVASYTGDFYIRTDGAEGGWNNYTKESHKFTYFTPYDGALYDYYWVQNIGKDGNKLSIKACIGNGINENLANMIEASSYTDEYGDITPDSGTGVNLRFGYNPETNYFERSILRGSTAGSSNFLNIVGNNIFDDDDCTKELNESNYTAHPEWSKFGDISNWVYEKNVYVKIDGSHQYANALLKSKAFNDNIIYQLGYTRDPITGAETHTPAQRDILSIGTTNRTYNIRIIYDFKTNRIVSAWSPIGDVTYDSEININADVLFVRHEGQSVAQVNLSNDAAKVSSLKSAYFVMEIDGSSDKASESIYWFSVPFDCEISSIFGVEGYVTLDGNGNPTAGTWGIQEYDGKSRAEKGWYAETATFWRWMRKNETLKKGHGYILVFDRSDANDKGLWKAISREEPCEGTGDGCVDGKKTVTTTVLRLYFPSSESGWQMTRSGEEQWVEYENWTCEKKDRKAQDSNWRLLGTDSYSNIKIDAAKQFERTEKDSVLDIAPYFVYVYDSSKPAYKRYAPISSIGMDFKSFNCYMVQFSGRINWNQYTQSIPEPVAARRIVSENEITNAQMTLSLKKGDATEDNTYIYMDARATTDFDNQMDLTKIVDNRANQVYSVVNGVEYAGNTLPVESQTIPLTVNINASGTYTFSMPDGTSGVSATLIDAQGGSRTDLSMWDYTVDLNKGTFAGRFFIEIDIRKTPTQIDVTNPDMLDENGNPIKTVKFLHEDQLYIQRGQHIYDATGKVVK